MLPYMTPAEGQPPPTYLYPHPPDPSMYPQPHQPYTNQPSNYIPGPMHHQPPVMATMAASYCLPYVTPPSHPQSHPGGMHLGMAPPASHRQSPKSLYDYSWSAPPPAAKAAPRGVTTPHPAPRATPQPTPHPLSTYWEASTSEVATTQTYCTTTSCPVSYVSGSQRSYATGSTSTFSPANTSRCRTSLPQEIVQGQRVELSSAQQVQSPDTKSLRLSSDREAETREREDSEDQNPPIAPHPFATPNSSFSFTTTNAKPSIEMIFSTRASRHGIHISDSSNPQNYAPLPQPSKVKDIVRAPADRFMEMALRSGIVVSHPACVSEIDESPESVGTVVRVRDKVATTMETVNRIDIDPVTNGCSLDDCDRLLSDFAFRFAKIIIESACDEIKEEVEGRIPMPSNPVLLLSKLRACAKEFHFRCSVASGKLQVSLNPDSLEFKPSSSYVNPAMVMFHRNRNAGVDVYTQNRPERVPALEPEGKRVGVPDVRNRSSPRVVDAAVNTKKVRTKDADNQTPLAFEPRDIGINTDQACVDEFYAPDVVTRDRGVNTVPLETDCRGVQARVRVKVQDRGVQVASEEDLEGELCPKKDAQIVELQMQVCHLRVQTCVNELQRQLSELNQSRDQMTEFFTPENGDTSEIHLMFDERILWLEEEIGKLKVQLGNCLNELRTGTAFTTMPSFGLVLPTSLGKMTFNPKALHFLRSPAKNLKSSPIKCAHQEDSEPVESEPPNKASNPERVSTWKYATESLPGMPKQRKSWKYLRRNSTPSDTPVSGLSEETFHSSVDISERLNAAELPVIDWFEALDCKEAVVDIKDSIDSVDEDRMRLSPEATDGYSDFPGKEICVGHLNNSIVTDKILQIDAAMQSFSGIAANETNSVYWSAEEGSSRSDCLVSGHSSETLSVLMDNYLKDIDASSKSSKLDMNSNISKPAISPSAPSFASALMSEPAPVLATMSTPPTSTASTVATPPQLTRAIPPPPLATTLMLASATMSIPPSAVSTTPSPPVSRPIPPPVPPPPPPTPTTTATVASATSTTSMSPTGTTSRTLATSATTWPRTLPSSGTAVPAMTPETPSRTSNDSTILKPASSLLPLPTTSAFSFLMDTSSGESVLTSSEREADLYSASNSLSLASLNEEGDTSKVLSLSRSSLGEHHLISEVEERHSSTETSPSKRLPPGFEDSMQSLPEDGEVAELSDIDTDVLVKKACDILQKFKISTKTKALPTKPAATLTLSSSSGESETEVITTGKSVAGTREISKKVGKETTNGLGNDPDVVLEGDTSISGLIRSARERLNAEVHYDKKSESSRQSCGKTSASVQMDVEPPQLPVTEQDCVSRPEGNDEQSQASSYNPLFSPQEPRDAANSPQDPHGAANSPQETPRAQALPREPRQAPTQPQPLHQFKASLPPQPLAQPKTGSPHQSPAAPRPLQMLPQQPMIIPHLSPMLHPQHLQMPRPQASSRHPLALQHQPSPMLPQQVLSLPHQATTAHQTMLAPRDPQVFQNPRAMHLQQNQVRMQRPMNPGQIDPSLYQAVFTQVAKAYPHLVSNPMMLQSVCLQQTMVLQSFLKGQRQGGGEQATGPSPGRASEPTSSLSLAPAKCNGQTSTIAPATSSNLTSTIVPASSNGQTSPIVPASSNGQTSPIVPANSNGLTSNPLQAANSVQPSTSTAPQQHQTPPSTTMHSRMQASNPVQQSSNEPVVQKTSTGQSDSSWNPAALVNMMEARIGVGDTMDNTKPCAARQEAFKFEAPLTITGKSVEGDIPPSLRAYLQTNKGPKAEHPKDAAQGEPPLPHLAKEPNPFDQNSNASKLSGQLKSSQKKLSATKARLSGKSSPSEKQKELFPPVKARKVKSNEDWEDECEQFPEEFTCAQDLKAPVIFETQYQGPEAVSQVSSSSSPGEWTEVPGRSRNHSQPDVGKSSSQPPIPPTRSSIQSSEDLREQSTNHSRNNGSCPAKVKSKKTYAGLDDFEEFGVTTEPRPNKLNLKFVGNLIKNTVSSNDKMDKERDEAGMKDSLDATKSEDLWQTVGVKKRKRDPMKIQGLISTAAPKSATKPKENNFQKLVEHLMYRFPLSRSEVVDVISTIRSQRGGLTGMTTVNIVEQARIVVQQKFVSKATSDGSAKISQQSSSSSNIFHTAEFQKYYEKAYAIIPSKTQITSPAALSNDEDVCPICFEGFHIGKLQKLDCGHEFHQSCIREWILGHERTCPTCRRFTLFQEEFPRLK